jgi:hypothetical protein
VWEKYEIRIILSENVKGSRSLTRPRRKCLGRIELGEVCVDTNWIHVSEDRNQWWAAVNPVMTFEFHKRSGTYSLSERLLASQGLRFMEFVLSLY